MVKLTIVLLTIFLLVSCSRSSSPQNVEALCNSSTGLRAPLPACSTGAECTRIAPELMLTMIDTPTFTPSCSTPTWDERFTQDVNGFTRHACIRRPSGVSTSSQRPLLIWLHPGGAGGADIVVTETGLIAKADTFDLSGDLARPGFILASVEGRNLRFPTTEPRDGQHHDFYYRDLNSPSTNPDIANIDALIDKIVLEGIVDPQQIYLAGWSNGAFFSQLYAIARHTTPSPGGNRVAAAAVFAAANPFGDVTWDPFNETAHDGNTSCDLTIPASTVPIFMVYRSSDLAVACDAVQAACFNTEPGYTTDQWITDASLAGMQMTGFRIGGLETGAGVALDAIAPSCTDYSGGCPAPLGDCVTPPISDACLSLVNHLRWPDGAYNSAPTTGIDRENDMLLFLKNNILP